MASTAERLPPAPRNTFVKELTPTWLATVARLAGQAPPRLDGDFTLVDIGAGNGLQTIVAAACHPEAEVWAVETDPSKRVRLDRRAREAQLDNVSVVGMSRLPDGLRADVVCIRGLDTATPALDAVVELLRARLAPGALVGVCYRPLASWTELAVLKRLVRMVFDRVHGTEFDRVRAAIGLLDDLRRAGAEYLGRRPRVAAALDDLVAAVERDDLESVRDPFLADSFCPLDFNELTGVWSDLGLVHVGSAQLTRDLGLGWVDDLQKYVDDALDPSVRQALRDLAMRSMIRTEVFAYGDDPLTATPELTASEMCSGYGHIGWGHPHAELLEDAVDDVLHRIPPPDRTWQTELRVRLDAGELHPATVSAVGRESSHSADVATRLVHDAGWHLDRSLGSAVPRDLVAGGSPR